MPEEVGFVAARIYSEHMLVQFISNSGKLLKEVTVPRNMASKVGDIRENSLS